MTPSPAPTSSGLVAGFGSPAICPTIASRRVTNRSVSHLMAGFFAVYFFVWLPMTTPGVSGAGAAVLMACRLPARSAPRLQRVTEPTTRSRSRAWVRRGFLLVALAAVGLAIADQGPKLGD